MDGDGGPAFPFEVDYDDSQGTYNVRWHPGMSLRDWYKGKALMGMCARLGANAAAEPKLVASACSDLADAVLGTQQGAWLPIVDAPEDTPVLVVDGDDNQAVARLPSGRFANWETTPFSDLGDLDYVRMIDPVAWQPLPPPPEPKR